MGSVAARCGAYFCLILLNVSLFVNLDGDEREEGALLFGFFVMYSRTSIARTPMARLPWLIRTRF